MISVDKRTWRDDKSHFNKWLFCILALGSLAACSHDPAPVSLTGATMGTRWTVTYIGNAGSPDSDILSAGIQARLDEVNRSMSTYQAESEISTFNRMPPKHWFRPSPDYVAVLQTALDVGERSGGGV